MKPTLASLRRDLAAMTTERDNALTARDVALQFHGEINAKLNAVRLALGPVLAYFGEQWISDKVRKEYRELAEFAKGERR